MMLLYTFLWIFLLNHAAGQWIDPHDLNTNAKEKYMQPTLKRSSSTSSITNGIINTCADSDLCFSHLKRIVGVLLNSAHINKMDPSMYYGNIRFNIHPDDLDFLMSFGKDSPSLDKLRRLDTVFSASFKKSFINDYLEQIASYQSELYSLVLNINILWTLGTIGLLYVVYQLFKNNFSLNYIIKYLMVMVIICDFVIRYQVLWEEADEHNATVTFSSNCDRAKMTWAEWTKFMLSNRNCERKTVTPLDVFLYQVKNLIIIPMHAFGTGMGGFGYNMFSTLPWGLNLIMWPLMLIFVIIVVVFTMVIFTGQTMEFNIFHLLKLKFGGTRPAQSENILTGATVERLMDGVLHRPMVQNITVSLTPGNESGNQQSENITALRDISNNASSSEESTSENTTSSNEVKSICTKNKVVTTDINAGTSDHSEKQSSNSTDDGNSKPATPKVEVFVEDIPLNTKAL